MWIIMVMVLAVSAFGQTTPPCTTVQGGVKSAGTLACQQITTPPPPPTGQLTINSTACAPGTSGSSYQCSMNASGGTTPYLWSSGTLPAGLSLNGASGVISGTPSAVGSSSFTVTVSDASTPQQTASRQLSINIVAAGTCGPPTFGCARTDYIATSLTSMGSMPPANGCQNVLAAYVAGNADYKPCNGQLHPCTPGASEVSTNPLLPDGVNHAGNLQSCGNIYGLNEILIDPNYKNVEILRITDAGDRAAGGCQASTGWIATMGFDANQNYILLGGCGAKWFNPATFQINTSKNPAGYVITSSGQTWSVPPNVSISQTVDGGFFDMPASATTGVSVVEYHVSNGVLDSTVPITLANLNFAIPCWADVSTMVSVNAGGTAVPMCGAWKQGNYPAGSVIVPIHNNAVYSQVAGCTPTTPCVCNDPVLTPQYCHAFQLIHKDPCTTGSVEPNWVIPAGNGVNQRAGVHVTSVQLTSGTATYTYENPGTGWTSIQAGQQVSVTGTSSGVSGAPNLFNITNQTVVSATATTFTVDMTLCGICLPSGQGNVAAVAQPAAARTTDALQGGTAAVIHDGSCDWADMWIPMRANWTAGRNRDVTDTIFSSVVNNNGGQDAVGGCHIPIYNSNTLTYHYLNTCTGNAYSTVCTGGTGFSCSGGHWTRTFWGNVYEQNNFYAVGDAVHTTPIPTSRFVMHAGGVGKSGLWASTGGNQCALGDNNHPLECWFGSISVNGAGCATAWCLSGVINQQQSIQGGGYFWQVGSINFTSARTIISTCCPGHAIAGFSSTTFSNPLDWRGGPSFALRTILPWNISNPGPSPASKNFWDLRVGPCTLPGSWTADQSNCVPRQCSILYGCTNGALTEIAGAVPTGVGNGVSDCLPWPCQARYNTETMLGRIVNWDQHMDWNMNRGSDDVPLCMQMYAGSNVAGAYFQGILGSIKYVWPPHYPWADEITCMATDGSNKVYREAYSWNTYNVLWFYPQYGYPGGTSNDGKFFLINTDMWCTTGGGIWPQYTAGTGNSMMNGLNSATPVGAVLCGLPFQSNHDYQLGEYVAPVQTVPTLRCESMVFKVVVAGKSGMNANAAANNGTCTANGVLAGVPPAEPTVFWNCAGAANAGSIGPGSGIGGQGCRVKQADGTAVFEYIGRSNAFPQAYVIKMQ